jgi:hypothetical protein
LRCVLLGRGLYVGLITRPEESNRLWCVWVWSRSARNRKIIISDFAWHYDFPVHGAFPHVVLTFSQQIAQVVLFLFIFSLLKL